MKILNLQLFLFFLFSLDYSKVFSKNVLEVPISSRRKATFVLEETLGTDIQQLHISYPTDSNSSIDGLPVIQRLTLATTTDQSPATTLAIKALKLFRKYIDLSLIEACRHMESQVFLRVTSEYLETEGCDSSSERKLLVSKVAIVLGTTEAEVSLEHDQCLTTLPQSHIEEIEITTNHPDWNEPKQVHYFIAQLDSISMIHVELSKDFETVITILADILPHDQQSESEKSIIPAFFELHYLDKDSEIRFDQALKHLGIIISSLFRSNRDKLTLRSCLTPKEYPFYTSQDQYPHLIHRAYAPMIGDDEDIRSRKNEGCYVPSSFNASWKKNRNNN